MKYSISLLLFSLILFEVPAQSTFWVVKGGVGDEAYPYRSAHLDTTDGGDIIWMYNTRSNVANQFDMAMEIWPQQATSGSGEFILGTSNTELLHNIYTYESEVYVLGQAVNPSVSIRGRPFMVRLDTIGNTKASFIPNGPTFTGNYGNYYEMHFDEDTAFVIGQGRSGSNEDYIFTKIDLSTNTQILSKTWNAGGTERLRGIVASATGDTLFVAAYSNRGTGIHNPVFISFDRKGNVLEKYYYNSPGNSFRQVLLDGDSLTFFTGGCDYMMRTDQSGNIGWTRSFVGDVGSCISIEHAIQHNNQYYMVGNIANSSLSVGGKEGILIVTDLAANVLWSKLYGGSGDEEIMDIQLVSDGIYLTGSTTSSLQGGRDVFLIKTDPTGGLQFTSSCYSVSDYTAQLSTDAGPSLSKSVLSLQAPNNLTGYAHVSMPPLPLANIIEDNCSALAIEEEKGEVFSEKASLQLHAYPNPFSDHIIIDLPDRGNAQVNFQLIDELGRVVMHKELSIEKQLNYRWDVPSLPRGLYVLRMAMNHSEGIDLRQQKVIRK